MTSSIINYVVEKYLANILEINTENTKSSLFSGTVEMGNLKIKPQIFNMMNIPYLELVNGYVGSLKIKMSLPRFYKYPIKIFIDKVFFNVRQKSLDKLNEAQEIENMEEYKRGKLQSLEEISSQMTELSAEEPGMVQQIINNLQIEIGDVFIRFEDKISYPGNPFVFGAILKKILIKTTSNKFEEDGSDNIPLEEINHKLIKVEGLSLFLDYFKANEEVDYMSKIVAEEKKKIGKELTKFLENSLDFYAYCLSELNHHSKDITAHHYLLYNLTIKLQVAMNESIKANEKPKIQASLFIDSLIMNLELKQLTVIFKLMGYLSLNNYYRIGIYKEFYKKELTLKEKKEYMEKYIEYYKLKYVKKYLNTKEADKIKIVLNLLENGLTYDQIQSIRQAAMIKIEYLFNIENIDTKITDIKSKWKIFSVFGSGNDDEQLKHLIGQKEKLKDSENKYENLIQEQLVKEKGVELDMYQGLPVDYVLYRFSLEMRSCVLSIGELDRKKLIDLVFSQFETHILLGLNFQNIFLYLNDFCVNQYKLNHPIFNKIIESYEDPSITAVSQIMVNPKDLSIKSKKNTDISQIDEISQNYSIKKGALYIEFENNPENELSNYRFKLRNEKRLYVYANIYVLQYAMNKVMDTMKSNLDLNEISKFAKGEVYKYIEQGYVNKIFSGEYQHFNIDIDLLFRGPVLVIPQNIYDNSNTSCMLFSMGECQISSSLPPKMDPMVDYTIIREYDKMYDVYTIILHGFNLTTMGDFTSLQSIALSKTKLDLLSNVNIELKIGNLIEPKNEYFENFRLGVKISNVQFFLRDIQIEFIIELLDGLMLVSNLLKEELDNIKSENAANEKDGDNRIAPHEEEKAIVVERRKSFQSARSIGAAYALNDNDIVIRKSLAQGKPHIPLSKKDKNFFSMEFLLYRVEFIIMKSLTAEEIPLFSRIQSQYSPNIQPFKNYLSFVINNFNFAVSISEKRNMKLNLKIFNMFLFDNDYIYKEDSSSSSSSGKSFSMGNSSPVIQELLVHPEFQCIMGSINDEDPDQPSSNNQSRSASIYSEAHEDPEIIIKKKAKKVNSFIEISYNFIAHKNKSVIEINFTKLLIALNLSTFTRLILFGTHYQNMLNKVTSKHQTIQSKALISKELKKKLEEIKEKKVSIKAATGSGSKGINNKFFKKVVSKMKEKKLGGINSNSLNVNKSINDVDNDKTSYVDNRHSQMKKSSVHSPEHEQATYTVKETPRFKLSFEMKEIELNFPLSPNSENTKVLKLNFNMMIKLKQLSEIENILTVADNRLIRQNFSKKNLNLNLMVFNVDFDVVNFLNNNFVQNTTENKILSNSRITLQMKNFLILEKETNVTNVELHVEPISMIIGFRQISHVMQFANSFSQFSQDIVKSIQAEAEYQTVMDLKTEKEEFFPAIDEHNNVVRRSMTEEEKEFDKYQSILTKKINELNTKLENQVKDNTRHFNALMDVNFKLDKTIIKLIDNTGYHEIPLAKIELSKVSFKFIQNSDPSDSDNMAQALIEMMTRREMNDYNIYNLYKYMDACFNVEVLSYNEKVSDWEPIMEPWNASVKITQVSKVTRLKIDFISDLFLNLNLSFSSVQIFNQMMKKFKEDESRWISEEKNNLIRTTKNNSSKKIISDNEISLEITNSSGVDLAFWLDADISKNKFNLKTNEKKYFTKDEISQINKKIKDNEISMMKKDKFSFVLLDCEPIESIDFSYNHFKNLRVKLGENNLPRIHSNFDFVEICIRIQNSGLIKSITIESNMAIHNNTHHKVGLLVVKANEFLDNFKANTGLKQENEKDIGTNKLSAIIDTDPLPYIPLTEEKEKKSSKEIFNFEEAKAVTIEPNNYLKVPLTWLIQPHMLLGRVKDEQNEQKSYKMLYEECNFVYNLRDEYNLISLDVKSESQKENMVNSLTAKYSKVISLDYKNKPINFSLDMMILRSKTDLKIETDLKEKNLNASGSESSQINHTTYNYIIAINPPIIVENQIPYAVDFSCDSDLTNLESNFTTTKLLPLQKFPIFYVNHVENKSDLKLSMKYFENLLFESDMFSFMDNVTENKKVVRMKNKKNTNDFLDFTIKYETYEYRSAFSLNYLKLERNLSKSKKITFFIEYLIVNKLDMPLYMKSSSLSDDVDILKMTNNKIYGHKVNLFNLPNEEKAKIKSEFSQWTRPLQINTHGVEGVINLEQIAGKDKEESYVTDVAMIISSSTNFNNSTVITLEPRYLLVNRLGIDIDYRQVLAREVPCKEILNIPEGADKVLTFKKVNEKIDKILKRVQLVIPDPHNLDFSLIDENWSPIINLDSIDELDVKLLIPSELLDSFRKNPILNEKNIFTYDGVNHFLLIRVKINTLDNGLIHIILAPSKNAQYLIKNETEEVIILKQEGVNTKTRSNICKILPHTAVPFTWSDYLILDKAVVVAIKNKEIGVSFENIEKLKEIKLSENLNDNYFISTSLENKNHTKVLKIQQDYREEGIKAIKQVFVGKKVARITKINISLKGLGLSIIDEIPQEVFYISIYCIDIRYVNNIFKSDQIIENTENLEVYIKNFQIDYCLEDSFKLLLFPKNQLIPAKEKELIENNMEIVPFVGLLISRKNIENLQTETNTTKISQIDFTMQELNVKIDQFVINTFLGLVNSLLEALDFYKSEGQNLNTNISKENFISNSDGIPADYCTSLSTELPDLDVISKEDDSSMLYIEALMLSALKINLTLRIDISTLEISLIPGFIVKILGTVGNALARISDSPLRFSELFFHNCFLDSNRINQFKKHYAKQGITQFYKILGSSDLIGNPIGLVDKLGTGFIELFNEPRKGFLEGPKQFGEGLAKGINSLVSNVVGGGFDTVGKITGTLYAATKNLQGESVKELKEDDEPTNLVSGAYEGVKGGLTEIGKGFAGIFLNPYKSAKQEGVKGFFKGVGTGLIGAIISPFSAVLKVGNSLAIGLRNTATFFSRGKLKTERFRHPRHIVVNEPLKPYDENYAEVQAIIRYLGDLSDNKLIFFADFKYIDPVYENEISTLIITDKKLRVVFSGKENIFSLDIRMIRNTEVHIVRDFFIMIFFLIDGRKNYVVTQDITLCCQVHGILQKLIRA